MEKFIIEEFLHYKVFIYGRRMEGMAQYSIQFKIPSGMVVIRFWEGLIPPNSYEEHNSKYTFYANFGKEKYPIFIDLMRYEKPLFFYYGLDTNLTYMTTSDEPVGEEESSDD